LARISSWFEQIIKIHVPRPTTRQKVVICSRNLRFCPHPSPICLSLHLRARQRPHARPHSNSGTKGARGEPATGEGRYSRYRRRGRRDGHEASRCRYRYARFGPRKNPLYKVRAAPFRWQQTARVRKLQDRQVDPCPETWNLEH